MLMINLLQIFKDSKRMQWLEDGDHGLASSQNTCLCPVVYKTSALGGIEFKSYRTAIDAAMKEGK